MVDAASQPFPSVDDFRPVEEGGPIARAGFDYQDEIGVGFLLDMIADESLIAIHFETQDDLVLVLALPGQDRVAEYVQVKAGAPDKLWSVSDICKRKGGRAGTSILEKSLSRDACAEASRFRLVTLRPVNADLRILVFPLGSPAREADGSATASLKLKLEQKLPGLRSPKGNDADYWLHNCEWSEAESMDAVRNANIVKLMRRCPSDTPILPDFAQVLLEELLAMVKAASSAKWDPDPSRKKMTRQSICEWLEQRLADLADSQVSGGKLRSKMSDAGLGDLANLAGDLRRDYSAILRTSSYMEDDHRSRLQRRVKSEMMSLRSNLMAGTIELDGPAFHALCIERLDAIGAGVADGEVDLQAFLQGCMYDITDRCLHRFVKTV